MHYVCRFCTHIYANQQNCSTRRRNTFVGNVNSSAGSYKKKKNHENICKSLAHCTWWDMASCLNFTRRDCSNYNFAFTRYPFGRLNYCYVYIILFMKNKNSFKKLRNRFWKLTKCEDTLRNTWILQNLKHNIIGSFSATGDIAHELNFKQNTMWNRFSR